jgi:hypothetical protein
MTDTNAESPAAAASPRRFRVPLGRRGWLLLSLALVSGGLALNWGWLTAIGVAPLLLGLAPCALMCVFGLCMLGGDAARSDRGSRPVAKTRPDEAGK